MRVAWILFFVPVLISTAVKARQCNTRGGYISEQPAPPLIDDENDVLTATAAADATGGTAAPAADPVQAAEKATDSSASIKVPATNLDQQTLRLDLSKDFTSLNGLRGRYTDDAPVLGLRLENLPNFNAARHCNIIQPILYKPKITRLPDGRYRASVDKARFSIEFSAADERQGWRLDPDPSARFMWIFPPYFGARSLPTLTARYDAAYLSQPKGSDRRRWIAEAYLDIAVRFHRFRELNKAYPTGWRPARADLEAAVQAKTGTSCTSASAELVCVASAVIERNEVAPPHDYISPVAFVLSDALLENSGLSAGIRQLDFASGNAQAETVVKALLPATLGKYRKGYGYRAPVRAWNVDLLNSWFNKDGPKANGELSRDDAKRLLISSHADFLVASASDWQNRVDRAYPAWTTEERLALAAVGIDLENVTGYRLNLPRAATGLCDVLTDKTAGSGKRTNSSVVRDQHRRVINAKAVLDAAVPAAAIDWSCIVS